MTSGVNPPGTKTETTHSRMLEILEKKVGLSTAEVEKAIYVMKVITEAKIKYPILQFFHTGKKKQSIDNSDILCQLKLAAISLLNSKNKDKVNRNLPKTPPKVKPACSTENDSKKAIIGIRELRKENDLKWKRIFKSSLTNPTNSIIDTNIMSSVIDEHEKIREKCYICKLKYANMHHFYNRLCPKCADFNFQKRTQSGNLEGKVALVTGGRIKIGYEVVLKLLRSGAFVITTTRFPANAAKRYSSECDFEKWKDRLHIYALDLRFIRHVEEFCRYVSNRYDRLDILIQNAAQTVRRPVAFYRHLFNEEINIQNQSSLIHSWDVQANVAIVDNNENGTLLSLSPLNSSLIPKSVEASQIRIHPEDHRYYESLTEINKHFPQDCYDEDHQQVDLRPNNSWLLEADQVDTVELIEVNLVNSIAPFIILSKLTPLLKKSAQTENPSHFGSIILVSAMEGKFNRFKTSKHPHTNCAKASLNMLVRSSAQYYRQFGLLLNAVDTGWITDEDPIPLKRKRDEELAREWEPPIDCIDGASRILDPVFQNINKGDATFGVFFKDYLPSKW